MTIREVTRILSGVFECPIAAARESRVVLSRDYTTILFQEDVHFQVLTGVARITREAESVSGDNYLCSDEGDSYLLCLSDGCGSGMEACRESENVVELLELFLLRDFPERRLPGWLIQRWCCREARECSPRWISARWISIQESVNF